MLQIANKVFFFLSCLQVKLESNLIIPVGDFLCSITVIIRYTLYSGNIMYQSIANRHLI